MRLKLSGVADRAKRLLAGLDPFADSFTLGKTDDLTVARRNQVQLADLFDHQIDRRFQLLREREVLARQAAIVNVVRARLIKRLVLDHVDALLFFELNAISQFFGVGEGGDQVAFLDPIAVFDLEVDESAGDFGVNVDCARE